MTEGEKIVKIETQMSELKDRVEKGFSSTEKRFDSMETMIQKFIDNSETKFASKWVENALKWSVTLVMGLIITAIVYLVIKR